MVLSVRLRRAQPSERERQWSDPSATLALNEWQPLLNALGRAGCCVGLVSADGRILAANDAYSRFLGYGEDELTRLRVQAVTHPDDIVVTARAHQAVQSRRDATSRVEKRYGGKDGAIRFARVTITLARPEDRDGVAVAVCEDLAPLREKETRIRDVPALVPGATPLAGQTGASLPPGVGALSRREREVVNLLLQGRRVGSIATALGLERTTVRNHVSAAFHKLGVRSQWNSSIASCQSLEPRSGPRLPPRRSLRALAKSFSTNVRRKWRSRIGKAFSSSAPTGSPDSLRKAPR